MKETSSHYLSREERIFILKLGKGHELNMVQKNRFIQEGYEYIEF